MLVDRDKAREACAKACEDYGQTLWIEPRIAVNDCAAAIRQLTLEECRVSEYDAAADAVNEVADAAQEAFRKAGIEPGEWDGDDIVNDVSRGIADCIESLSAQVAALTNNPWEDWGSAWRWKLTPVRMDMKLVQPDVIRDRNGVRAGIQYAPYYAEEPSDECPVCTLKGQHGHSVEDIERLRRMAAFIESKLGVATLAVKESGK